MFQELKIIFSLVTALLIGISLQSQPAADYSNMDKQGHRGCRGLMPENTIAAMYKAIDLGVTTLEMDVSFTKDSMAILSHEPFFSHHISLKPDGSPVTKETEKNFNIFKMTYEEVKKFDVGMKPHPFFPRQEKMNAVKPLLSELIDSVEAYCAKNNKPQVQYNIETKTKPSTDNEFHPAPPAFVEELMKVITMKKIGDRTTIQSFDIRTLQYLHRQFPAIKTSLLIEQAEKMTIEEKIAALGFKPTVLSPHYLMTSRKLISEMHQQDIKVVPWTVNSAAGIRRLRRIGADGIITDYPDLFLNN